MKVAAGAAVVSSEFSSLSEFTADPAKTDEASAPHHATARQKAELPKVT